MRDQPIGVLGTGPGSVQRAHLLRQWTDDVMPFTHTHPVTAEERVTLDADDLTSVAGVWAAGNAVNPRAQVITAAGEGSAVAIAINTELVQYDIDSTMQRIAAVNAA